jgi:deoxyribodipyrimidine photo-lyase
MTVPERPSLVWFRDDLRVGDNPALNLAVEAGAPVLAVFVLDDESPGFRALGGARRWWLHGSLTALASDLERLGIPLVLRRGSALRIIPDLASMIRAGKVTWNRRYGAAEIEVDREIKARLSSDGHEPVSLNGHLMFEPWQVKTGSGGPYRVFTPFWKAARALGSVRAPLSVPERIKPFSAPPRSDALADWALLPTRPDWSGGLRETWTPGSSGAVKRLDTFIARGFAGYAEDRNRPDMPSTSMLSAHLAHGEISTVQVWHAQRHAVEAGRTRANAEDQRVFESELGWREFAYHLLHLFPRLDSQNFQPKFDAFPWRSDASALKAWQRGQTGYPIVDAGMRQLWTTGFMHNRVRMIVGSFLVKHLLIDWREGEKWFWDTLVDADPASNTASWQWVAGTGADAAPYFRIFNPVTQGERFDPNGDYVRRYVPELARLPADIIHAPWAASPLDLSAAGISLGRTYPKPVVDHAFARERALAALSTLKTLA